MVYPRKLTQKLIKEINSPRIVVLTGMRQTGKTTLMRQVFDMVKDKNKAFLDLENPLIQKVFDEENYDNVLLNLREFGIDPKKRSYLFLDEVQLMPVVSRVVKYLYDHYQIKFFLTGSSSFYLKNLFPESLAGRKIIYEIFPLDFEEFLVFKEKKKVSFKDFSRKAKNKNKIAYEKFVKLHNEYLTYGGFPGVVVEPIKKREILEDIFKSYFEKDVRTLADFREIRRLRELILLLANRVGSKIEVSKVSSEIGISRETVYSYLEFLEKTYFISLISPFSKSLNGEVRGAKKVYFCDNGLLSYLGINSPGVLLENSVFHNLKCYGKINYYERYKGPAIDFILNKEIAFEVKTFGDLRDISRLERITRRLKMKDYYLVTKNFFNHPKTILITDL